MTSFPMLRWDDPFSRLYLSFSSLSWREDTENDLQDGVLDLWWNERSLLSFDPPLDGGKGIT